MREKGKYKVYPKLRAEIYQHEQSDQRVGDPIERSKCQKEQRGDVSRYRHRNIRRVAGELEGSVIGFHF